MLSYIDREVNTMADIQTETELRTFIHQVADQLPKGATLDDAIYRLIERRDIDAGMADIEAGRVISGEKVMAWIDSWGTENEQEPPTL